MKNIRVSYVGHWKSTKESLVRLYHNIIPTMAEKKINFEIDNTACMAMSSPDLFVNALKTKIIKIPKGLKLSYRGNQALSVGVWDERLSFLKSYNIGATWDSVTNKIRYDTCDEFRGRACSVSNKNRSVLCENNSKLHMMSCSDSKSKSQFPSSRRGPSPQAKKWTLVSDSGHWREFLDYRLADLNRGKAYLERMLP
jgi:hypothetical protein